ncbi:protein-glutamate O-methyltransferase CheR [Halorutilales archaeon Cl-col2-1]
MNTDETATEDVSDDDSFDEILGFVEDEMEFATSYYETSYLDRRISSRMRRTGSDAYADYLEVLRSEEDERAALLDALSVNVTSFFRNPEVWEKIREILRDITDDRRSVKLWSAASSDGREAYSMAMLSLEDPEIDASKISIKATDIDAEIIKTAKKGVYETTKTEDISEQLCPLDDYSQYIDRDGDSFEVTDEVKEMVSFEQHDLINGRPKSGFDLVACRNLFIYIDSEYKVPILTTIRDSLVDDGYLVIGKTESLPSDLKNDFESVDSRLRVYRKSTYTEG